MALGTTRGASQPADAAHARIRGVCSAGRSMAIWKSSLCRSSSFSSRSFCEDVDNAEILDADPEESGNTAAECTEPTSCLSVSRATTIAACASSTDRLRFWGKNCTAITLNTLLRKSSRQFSSHNVVSNTELRHLVLVSVCFRPSGTAKTSSPITGSKRHMPSEAMMPKCLSNLVIEAIHCENYDDASLC